MYQCTVVKHIWRNVERTEFGANLRCEITLPFTPFIGLDYLNEGINFRFRTIEWRQKEDKFFCYAEDGSISGIRHDHFTFDELVNDYKNEGWDIRGIVKPGEFMKD